MSADFRTLLVYLGALALIGMALFILLKTGQVPSSAQNSPSEAAQIANVVLTLEPTSPTPPSYAPPPTRQTVSSARRIENPYPFLPESFPLINERTRVALVNIFCTMNSNDGFQSTSGSGVIIDPRGIILTNAHVAQYLLIAESGRTNLSCSIRYGAPARPLWEAEVLYVPPIWIQEHAADITQASPTGTGEHDYALLRITRSIADPSPSITSVPFIPFDIREAIAFPTDAVLAASYPSEFIGSVMAQSNLYPISSTAPVRGLLTFQADTIDLISLGGTAEAQSGSSGGPVVNAWGHLVGIITTTGEGVTTAERELRALTLSYINRDLSMQTGSSLAGILSGDAAAQAAEFRTKQAPALVRLLIDEISK